LLAVMLCANCQSPPKNCFSMSGEPGRVHGSGLSGSGSGFGSGSSLPLSLPAGGSGGLSGGAYSRGDVGVFGSSGPL
jgi:hypothetical protein